MSFLLDQQQRTAAAGRGELSRLYTGINRNTPNFATHVGPDAPAGVGPGPGPGGPPGPLPDEPGGGGGGAPPRPGDGPIPQIRKPGPGRTKMSSTTRKTRQIGGVRSPLSVR